MMMVTTRTSGRRNRPPYFVLMAVLILAGLAGCETDRAMDEQVEERPPNIIYILADDLGYGELGAYGQEIIETPNIDALAEAGMMFNDHYSGSPVCAPSRFVLMTGQHTGNAYIRGNSELDERGDIWSFEAMYENPELEGQRPIKAETVTVADKLKEAGYATAAIGKWGLGPPHSEGHPNNHGFDLFYGMLCQRQAHTFYPTHLWRNNEREYLENELVDPHQTLPEGADPYDIDSYAPFHEQPQYSPTLMKEVALEFIEENRGNPFFLYYPTQIPHVSLQAPQRWIDHYHEIFGDEEPYYSDGHDGHLHYTPVRYPKATYAAMISYLDEQVGEIVDKLKELGIYEDSLIMFTSDNGPVEGYGVDPEFFNSGGPFRATRGWNKGTVHEGGVRVPMVATWEGVIPAGSTTDHMSAFWDIMPTFADVAGFEAPENIDGISFYPTLTGNVEEQERHDYLYWEFTGRGGQQAVRMDQWKAVRMDILTAENLEIELYDLENDPWHENNVAGEYPEITEQMSEIMRTARTVPELAEFRMPALGD